ncbi:alpha/beta-hydrolase [Aspergillus steynii IBT 23096]|uniref:Alpha/beta-hydrolase n=1 Tax=Aspergillus steynii IBT 23096 TaxID=1392250 RepID=A0A2I2GAF4_9EURO|nr:alpha/beta-hydrolase [Aspergillus steynii IBT 23096]PLB49860.1 alpha/beta-hydrolase [Aspergillus steynii IBT 23096]
MDTVLHIQGSPDSSLTPLILIHAISGLALPYFALGPLSYADEDKNLHEGRPVYGISAPIYEHGSPFAAPGSLFEVAALYVSIIRREIQPKGPYLLGGWSMGGMIAVEMAAILTAEGETVQHVILIDSLNPELYPPFQDAREHHVVSTITYNAIARRMNAPEESASAPLRDEDGSSSSDTSRESSDGEIDSEDEAGSMVRFYSQLRQHIHHGLRMLSSYRSAIPGGQRPLLPNTNATLIKCETLGTLSPLLRDKRRDFARKINRDATNGWSDSRFKSFATVPFSAMHDGCFDESFAGELTLILRNVLGRSG